MVVAVKKVKIEPKRSIVLVPPEMQVSETLGLVKGWDKLEVRDKDIVITETKAILALRHTVKHAMGEHLAKVRKILEPKKMFEIYLRGLDISRATAYRYIGYFETLEKTLPPPVLIEVLKRDVVLSAKRVEAFPPPKDGAPGEINKWIDMQERGTGRIIKVSVPEETPEMLMKQNINDIRRTFSRLPNNHKTKAAWIIQLCGMCLGLAGMSGTHIEAVAIPESLKVVRGRPRKV